MTNNEFNEAVQDSLTENSAANLEEKLEVTTSVAAPVENNTNHEETLRKQKEVVQQLSKFKDSGEAVEVTITEKTKGGLRAVYEGVKLFMPLSLFAPGRNTSDADLEAAIGKSYKVKIKEVQDSGSYATVVISRKDLMEDELWNKFKVGDKVEGTVSSTPTFGIFLDLGGLEGLIHISRLSQSHVESTEKFAKKGDKLEAVIIELDRAANRIALSRKELEPSPWSDAEEKYPSGLITKGTVRRMTNFGAYVELAPNVDGLLRFSELSWTRRVNDPSEFIKLNSEVEVYVVSCSADKRTIALSYKRTQENPWNSLIEKYPIGSFSKGVVSQITEKGAVITVNNEVDGFMPRGKMRGIMNGNKIPFNVGDEIQVAIDELVPEKESLILSPVLTEEQAQEQENSKKGFEKKVYKEKRENVKIDASHQAGNSGFSLGDLLSSLSKDKLSNIE